jgi:hypothetical protein
MATLKEHQAAMVDLLANGSGIPASASRLAHAMHDVIQELLGEVPVERLLLAKLREDATTPGLNDKALSTRKKALKTDSPAKWPTPAEQRVKELENTIKQLRDNISGLKANNAKLQLERDELQTMLIKAVAQLPEQAGCRKEDTQVCEHRWASLTRADQLECLNCGIIKQ